MRPLEGLLSLANLLTLAALALPLPPALRQLRHLAPVALVIAAVHVLVERPRWQMVPAYVLSGLLVVVWLVAVLGAADGLVGQRWLRWLAATAGVVVLAVSMALPIIVPVFRLPRPTGPYAVGTVTHHWVDEGREEIFTAGSGDHRELMAQIWYPAAAGASGTRSRYVDDAAALAAAVQGQLPYPGALLRHLGLVTTNAVTSAPVADGEPSYPVLLYLSGLYGFRQVNTVQVEELASRGYVVVGLDQPYAAASVRFPDGRRVRGWPVDEMRVLVRPRLGPRLGFGSGPPRLHGRELPEGVAPYLAQDAVSALDQLAALNRSDPQGLLTGRLDLERSGLFGVSLGGIDGAEACKVEPRLRACILIDATMPDDVAAAGLPQPAMWLTRDGEVMRREGWPRYEIDDHVRSMRAAFERSQADRYLVEIDGAYHLDFTDAPLWFPVARWLGVSGPIGGSRAHRIVNDWSAAFFDRYLRGVPAALLDGPGVAHPEVHLETRRASAR